MELEQCEFRWLGVGLGWGQVTYCKAEFHCEEPGGVGDKVGDPAFTLCMAE